MKKKFDRVYQFKITLKDIKPLIWRRIQVPETYTFWDLHVAIQDAMGWLDYHLHEFEMAHPSSKSGVRIGIPDEDFGQDIIPAWNEKIAKYFSLENQLADYTYDFGDNWEHKVKLEKILPRAENTNYPICVAGKRACPPEDCGGPWGYEDFLKIIHNPRDEEYEEMMEWVGGEFDPEYFDARGVIFDDPMKRRRGSL
ncbi:plasmid pRiA4b ORF-3 family protein [Candidatus Aerophobetes bacterium]|nr:plasmid pRiA4b ORF-3 family protein [Candidatus Aerophobetes bacterium]